jgi:hypothetical protein
MTQKNTVIPAKTGTHASVRTKVWIPTFAGMTMMMVCAFILIAAPGSSAFAADAAAKDKPAAAEKTATAKDTAKESPLSKDPDWLAQGSVYSPEGCEFQVTFPEQPYNTQHCDPIEKGKNCSDMTSFTKVYGIDSTVTYNVSCTATDGDMYGKYDDNVMRTTLQGMTRTLNLDTSQTGFMPLKEAKMAVLLGSGKTENGQDDLIYTAQLWIGHKSVFTLEGQLRGKYQPDADRLFAEILKTAKLKGTATPVDVDGNVIEPKSKSSKPAGSMAAEAAKAEKSEDNPDKK